MVKNGVEENRDGEGDEEDEADLHFCVNCLGLNPI